MAQSTAPRCHINGALQFPLRHHANIPVSLGMYMPHTLIVDFLILRPSGLRAVSETYRVLPPRRNRQSLALGVHCVGNRHPIKTLDRKMLSCNLHCNTFGRLQVSFQINFGKFVPLCGMGSCPVDQDPRNTGDAVK